MPDVSPPNAIAVMTARGLPQDRERPFAASLGLHGVCLNERFGGKMSARKPWPGPGTLRSPQRAFTCPHRQHARPSE